MHKDKLTVFSTPPNKQLEEYKLPLNFLMAKKKKESSAYFPNNTKHF